ncbi:MAG: ribosome maturation factor [Bacteroidota bacterium]|jgi:ribosome maturation factor RimP|nr:ribosome maturation factor [Bacteroidota bacterium]
MNTALPLEQIEHFLLQIIEQTDDVFLVEVKMTLGNQITVLVDADNGITIEKCTSINKVLYKYLEESGLFADGNFSLEVSSPGVDRPLKLHRQYMKNIGRTVEVELNDGTKLAGKLTQANDEEIVIEQTLGKGKKVTMKTITILFNQIKHTIVLITF